MLNLIFRYVYIVKRIIFGTIVYLRTNVLSFFVFNIKKIAISHFFDENQKFCYIFHLKYLNYVTF